MSHFHELQIQSADRPLPDVVTLSLRVPEHLRETFAFVAGQHLGVQREIDGETLRRNYSIHSCPYSWTTLDISVRHIPRGRVSGDLFANAKPGQTLRVSPPRGRFIAETGPKSRRTWFLFAAGTGITPILSMTKAVLQGEPKSFVRLLYGNRNQDSILFAQELEELSAQFGARFLLQQTLSAPQSGKSWYLQRWEGMTGRIDKGTLDLFIQAYPAPAQDCQYRICGPDTMNRGVRDYLVEIGVEAERIRFEHFGAPLPNNVTDTASVASDCEVELGPDSRTIHIPQGQRLLDAMRSQGISPPYSCESGVCGTCVAQLVEGEVYMKHRAALDDEDVQAKKILVCQALARSPHLKIRFSP